MATRRKRKNTKRWRSAFTHGGPWTPWRKASKKFKRAQRKARLARLRRRKAGLWGGSRNPRGKRGSKSRRQQWDEALAALTRAYKMISTGSGTAKQRYAAVERAKRLGSKFGIRY